MMVRVLIVKTSSLGDVAHTLPAVTDAARAIPDIHFDWLVEEAFAEIPAWHPAVERVIPVALRRWGGNPLKYVRSPQWRQLRETLNQQRYDYVVDAQGLVKSAWLASLAHGRRCGFNWQSAREPLASLCYQRRYSIARGQHAITRVRQLFAAVLGYSYTEALDYGIDRHRLPLPTINSDYVMFLHGTTWPNKHWPERYWQVLAGLITAAGLSVVLPWGTVEEQQRAQRIQQAGGDIVVLPRLGLTELAGHLQGARAVVGVDTGLAHVAAALRVPSITLYGPTKPGLSGTLGVGQQHLVADFECAPCLRRQCRYTGDSDVTPACFQSLPPQRVWQQLVSLLGLNEQQRIG